jgi:hypothetical protein
MNWSQYACPYCGVYGRIFSTNVIRTIGISYYYILSVKCGKCNSTIEEKDFKTYTFAPPPVLKTVDM